MAGKHRAERAALGMTVRRRPAGDHQRFVAAFEDAEPGTVAGSWWDPRLRAQVNAECRARGLRQPFPRVRAGEDPSETMPLPVPHPRAH